MAADDDGRDVERSRTAGQGAPGLEPSPGVGLQTDAFDYALDLFKESPDFVQYSGLIRSVPDVLRARAAWSPVSTLTSCSGEGPPKMTAVSLTGHSPLLCHPPASGRAGHRTCQALALPGN